MARASSPPEGKATASVLTAVQRLERVGGAYLHIHHVGDVPFIQRLVEGGRAAEHVLWRRAGRDGEGTVSESWRGVRGSVGWLGCGLLSFGRPCYADQASGRSAGRDMQRDMGSALCSITGKIGLAK